MSNLVVGIISSLLGALIFLLGQILFRYFREERNPFTGTWLGLTYDELGNIKKRDVFYIKQRGNLLVGTIKREYPESQAEFEYSFDGRMQGRGFLGIYWANDPTQVSFGCWYLRLRRNGQFEGYYLSLQEALETDDRVLQTITKHKCSLKKYSSQARQEIDRPRSLQS